MSYPLVMALLVVAAVVALQFHYSLGPIGTAQSTPVVEVTEVPCD